MPNLSEQEIDNLLARRFCARNERKFDVADKIQHSLLELSIVVDDRLREWRFSSNGHGYTRATNSGPMPSNISMQKINELIAVRSKARILKKFDAADKIQVDLKKAGIFLDDQSMLWDSSLPKPYRSGIMAVFTDSQRENVLVCKRKRSRFLGEWQFPQGGVKNKEHPEAALFREVAEELGNNKFRILRQAKNLIRYDFSTSKFKGQEHQWFLCEYNTGMGPELEKAKDDDFDEYDWVHPKQALEIVVPWKRDAYLSGLKELGML
eukprot:CAMPEP_0194226118 /NCGR_PEP_ID=MMETSP0156-20130528/41200_1 /TAXON_ID=33649 /ORGANISM="Thalassionema nitzschioides, Strain L26-B" /LENGTH=264 /DNA_ID=CAMNT_0038958361 /DNA_START=138 /DNA_END=932 /DNA_ORIENTATION=-